MPKNPDNRLLIFLTAFVILAIGIGYLQIKRAIYSPFQQNKLSPEDISKEIEILAMQDTDKDGLTDFDERFVYQTSAYIFDSDSDGFSDKQEIDAESDPLNPESTPYSRVSEGIIALESEDESFLEKTFPSPEEKVLPEQDISVQEIRDLLINQAGLSKDVVDKFDDKTLIKLYNETKQETGIDLKNLQAPEELMRQFSDLDIKTLRQLLIEQGLDPEMLQQVDDEALRTLFLQSLLQLK